MLFYPGVDAGVKAGADMPLPGAPTPMVLLLLIASALAGDGPWTLGPRENNVFLGLDYYRYSELDPGDGSTAPLPSPLTADAITGVWTFGLREGVEGELKVPYESVRADEPQSSACTGVSASFCKPTSGIGDLGGEIKVRALNELYGPPLTVALSAGFRSGEAYADERGRLTTLGDGQTDVGLGASLGRTDVLGKGWYRVGFSGWYWYRFGNGTFAGHKVPADELSGSFAAMVAPVSSFALGPALSGFWRLGGVDVPDAVLTDINGFDSLNARQIQVGGKLGVYATNNGPTFSLTVLRTVYAHNNPSDTLVISAGIGWFFRPKDST